MNLELNSPYTTPDNVINGDGTGLAIQHTCSFTLPILSQPLLLIDVLPLPSMSKNLISMLALCATNLAIVFFLLFLFSSFESSHEGNFGKGTI